MMPKNITYRNVEQLLTELGFSVGDTTGHHRLFEFPGYDSVILLPQRLPDESVDAAHLAAVRRNVTEKGIVDGDTFDAMLASQAKISDRPMLLSRKS